MQKRNTITIDKRDLWRMLANEGIKVPEDGYMHMEEDCGSIEIRWSEEIRPAIKHPEDALSLFSIRARRDIMKAMEDGNRLAAIKAVRGDGDAWTLMSAKDWVEEHYPRI